MKITKQRLRQLIKEELEEALKEEAGSLEQEARRTYRSGDIQGPEGKFGFPVARDDYSGRERSAQYRKLPDETPEEAALRKPFDTIYGKAAKWSSDSKPSDTEIQAALDAIKQLPREKQDELIGKAIKRANNAVGSLPTINDTAKQVVAAAKDNISYVIRKFKAAFELSPENIEKNTVKIDLNKIPKRKEDDLVGHQEPTSKNFNIQEQIKVKLK